ncbi:MAG TPA: 50S ribosomal protein L4 [Candidatus Dormibacteraeota bacterium]|jgi:large subunit ribosomal protein L4|nr:50S ribosomal protein L4 [Candidatus Dormibacteraeota bacterium]
MASAPVVDQSGLRTGSLELSAEIFDCTVNGPVMHQALLRQLANGRQGTHDTLNRREVRGGGRKPYRQKGTGRARQGSIRSPQFKGGGVVFGPTPRSYRQDMPRKQRRLALRSALSAKAQAGELLILEGFTLEEPKTRAVAEMLQAIATEGGDDSAAMTKVLLVLGSHNDVLERSARNLREVRVLLAANLNIRDLLTGDTVLMTRDAVEHLTEVLSS